MPREWGKVLGSYCATEHEPREDGLWCHNTPPKIRPYSKDYKTAYNRLVGLLVKGGVLVVLWYGAKYLKCFIDYI